MRLMLLFFFLLSSFMVHATDDIESLDPIHVIDFDSTIQDAHWCPDNTCLAVLVALTTVAFYDVDSFEMTGTVVDTTGIFDFKFSPNGNYLITEGGLSSQGDYKVWETATLTNVITIDQSYETRFYDFDEVNDAFFAVNEALNKTHIWKLSTGELISTFEGVIYSSHSNNYWVAGRADSIELVTPWTMEVEATFNVPAYIVEWNRVDDSSVILVLPDAIEFWEAPFEERSLVIGTRNAYYGGFLNLKNHLLYWNDENFEFIDTENSKNSFELEVGKPVHLAMFSWDDEEISTTADDSIIALDYTTDFECYSYCAYETAIWNTETKTLLSTIQHGITQTQTTQLINEDLAISISDAYRLIAWNPQSGKQLFLFPQEDDGMLLSQIEAFRVNPNKTLVVTWSLQDVYIWEIP